MSQLPDERSIGSRTPFLVGAQLGLLLLATPCAITPSFEGMYEPMDCCLPLVTELVMNPSYGIVGGLVVLGILVQSFTRRGRLARPALLAWSAVLLGALLVVLYVFGLYAPLAPL